MRRLSLILIVFLALFFVSGSSGEISIDEELDMIHSADKIYGDSEVRNVSVETIDESNYETLENYNVGVYDGFELTNFSNGRIQLSIYEDKDWAKNYIENHPESFNGPGHQYSSGLYRVIEGENLEEYALRYNDSAPEELFEIDLTEPGQYYVVFSGTNSTKAHYVNDEGDCKILYGTPSDEYEEVDNCADDNNSIAVYLVIGSVFALIIGIGGIKSYNHIRYKILIREINNRIATIKTEEQPDKEKLEKLYTVMDEISEMHYKKASKLLDEID